MVAQWGFKQSGKINSVGDTYGTDLTLYDTNTITRLIPIVAGRCIYTTLAAVDGVSVRLAGDSWKIYNWSGAHFHVCTGASYGSNTTIATQSDEVVTLSSPITLAVGDLVRIEAE